MAGQASLDFHSTLEGMVCQGYRNHRAVGNPEELIWRVFLQGLPGWLKELLTLKDDESVQLLLDCTKTEMLKLGMMMSHLSFLQHLVKEKFPVSRARPRPIRQRDQHFVLVCWGCR